jgi:hypothetical protein
VAQRGHPPALADDERGTGAKQRHREGEACADARARAASRA